MDILKSYFLVIIIIFILVCFNKEQNYFENFINLSKYFSKIKDVINLKKGTYKNFKVKFVQNGYFGNVVNNNYIILNNNKKKIDGYTGRWFKEENYNLINKLKIDTSKKDLNIFIFSNDYDRNISHFNFETFQTLYIFFLLKKKFKNLKLVIRKKNPKFFEKIIDLLEIRNKMIEYDSNKLYLFNKIFYVKSDLAYVSIQKNPIIKKLILRSNKLNKHKKKYSKIWLSRDEIYEKIKRNEYFHNRYIVNKDKIDPFFKNYKNFIPNNYSFDEQIYLMSNADIIVSEIGAGCENVIYTKPSCKFIIYMPDFLKSWFNARYKNYNKFNKNIIPIICGKKETKKEKKNKDPWNHPWTIDYKLLKSKLLELKVID